MEAQYLTVEDIVEIIDYVPEVEEDFEIDNDNMISITEY